MLLLSFGIKGVYFTLFILSEHPKNAKAHVNSSYYGGPLSIVYTMDGDNKK